MTSHPGAREWTMTTTRGNSSAPVWTKSTPYHSPQETRRTRPTPRLPQPIPPTSCRTADTTATTSPRGIPLPSSGTGSYSTSEATTFSRMTGTSWRRDCISTLSRDSTSCREARISTISGFMRDGTRPRATMSSTGLTEASHPGSRTLTGYRTGSSGRTGRPGIC